eukprot:1752884-Ditylum_brightwellii.AAC.1
MPWYAPLQYDRQQVQKPSTQSTITQPSQQIAKIAIVTWMALLTTQIFLMQPLTEMTMASSLFVNAQGMHRSPLHRLKNETLLNANLFPPVKEGTKWLNDLEVMSTIDQQWKERYLSHILDDRDRTTDKKTLSALSEARNLNTTEKEKEKIIETTASPSIPKEMSQKERETTDVMLERISNPAMWARATEERNAPIPNRQNKKKNQKKKKQQKQKKPLTSPFTSETKQELPPYLAVSHGLLGSEISFPSEHTPDADNVPTASPFTS